MPFDPDEEKQALHEGIENEPPKVDPEIAEMKSLIAGLQQQLEGFKSGFSAAAPRQPAVEPAKEPTFNIGTDTELEEALEEGDYKRYHAFQRERERKREYEYQKQISAVQNMGVQKISQLTKTLATRDLPYYAKYQKEIDELVQGSGAENQMNPETYQMAHDIVKARHMDDLIAEEVAKQLEQRERGTTPTNLPGGQGTRQFSAPTTPGGDDSPRLGQDELAALELKGFTPDSFAQKLGYKSWAEYTNLTEGEAA